jgi:hypothetical protein
MINRRSIQFCLPRRCGQRLRIFVPEGHMTIARRFNAGLRSDKNSRVPEGRLKSTKNPELASGISAVPSGLIEYAPGPGVETPGYCRSAPSGRSVADYY